MSESTGPRRAAMSDQELIEGTGADWKTWLALLDERDAAGLEATASLLVKEFGVDGWWARSIAVGYERERGARASERSGGYRTDATATVPAGVAAVFEWVADTERHPRWLTGLELSQRGASPPRSVRFAASDGTAVLVDLADQDGATTVRVEIEGLASAEQAATARSAWRERLARLAEVVPR